MTVWISHCLLSKYLYICFRIMFDSKRWEYERSHVTSGPRYCATVAHRWCSIRSWNVKKNLCSRAIIFEKHANHLKPCRQMVQLWRMKNNLVPNVVFFNTPFMWDVARILEGIMLSFVSCSFPSLLFLFVLRIAERLQPCKYP